MELRQARGGERDEVLDLLARGTVTRFSSPATTITTTASATTYAWSHARAGRIVTTAQMFERIVNLRGARVPLGGVGSVYTMESHRSRGPRLGADAVAVTTMERESFEVSLLFAERLDFYARFGWRPLTRQFSALADTRTMSAAAGFRLARLAEARDLMRSDGSIAIQGLFDAPQYATRWMARQSPLLRQSGEYFVVCRPTRRMRSSPIRRDAVSRVPMVMEYGYAPEAVDAMLAWCGILARPPSGACHRFRWRTRQRYGGAANPADPLGPALLVTHTAHDRRWKRICARPASFVMHHPDNFYMVARDRAAQTRQTPRSRRHQAEAALFAMLQRQMRYIGRGSFLVTHCRATTRLGGPVGSGRGRLRYALVAALGMTGHRAPSKGRELAPLLACAAV